MFLEPNGDVSCKKYIPVDKPLASIICWLVELVVDVVIILPVTSVIVNVVISFSVNPFTINCLLTGLG